MKHNEGTKKGVKIPVNEVFSNSNKKKIHVASFIPNPNNADEVIVLLPSDYVEGFTYKDYLESGFIPVKR